MAVDHVQSTPVSNAYATPAVASTAGEGAPGVLREVSGFATAVASSSQDSTYRFVRVPSNAVIKQVKFSSEAQAGGTVDLGVYRPVNATYADLVTSAIDQDFFASAIAVTNFSAWTDVTNEATGANASYDINEINTPLWEAAGLSADPGGFLDIVGTIVSAITTGTGVMGCSVVYAL